MMKEKILLKRDSIELYGILEGPELDEQAKHPLALIMHGFNTSSRQHPFYYLVRALWEQGISTLRFDFEGHGRSGGSMLTMTLDQLLEDAELYYQYARNIESVSEIYVIGYSMGGVIAGRLAVNHKDEVKKMVLLSPAGDIQERVKSGRYFGTVQDPENPPEILETDDFKIGKAWLVNALTFLIYEPLKEFTGKALIVYGEEDEKVPLKHTLRYKDYIRNLTLSPVPGEGHMWNKKGEEAVQIIVRFLQDPD